MAVQISGNDITVPRDTTVTRNLTVGGVLTYEDVTNVDSVGLVTARSGIEIGARPGVGASISVDGNAIFSGITTATTLRSTTGIVTTLTATGLTVDSGTTNTCATFQSSDAGAVINLTDNSARSSISQNGTDLLIISDTDAGDADSTIKFQVDSSTKAIINSSGQLLLGTTTEGASNANNLTIASSSSAGMTLRSGTTSSANIYFSDATSGAGEYAGFIQYNHTNDYLIFGTGGSERLRIDSSGQFSLGRTSQITGNGNSSTSVFEQLSNSNYPLALHSSQTNKRGLLIFYATTGAGNAGDPFIVCTDNTNNKFQVTSDGTTTIRGNLVMATAGKGIDFSSSQTSSSKTGATTNSEVFDHYEEGTFTPTYDGTWTNIDNSHVRHSRYTRVGDVCHVWMEYFMTNNNGAWADQSNIRGFPFTGRQSLYVPVTLTVMYGPSGYSTDSNAAGRAYFDSYDDRLYFKMGSYSGVRHIWVQFSYLVG